MVYDLDGRLVSNAALPGSLGYLSTPQLEVLPTGVTSLAIPFGVSNTRSGVMQLNGAGGAAGLVRYPTGATSPVDLREVTSLHTDTTTLLFGATTVAGRILVFRLGADGALSPAASTTLPGGAAASITALATGGQSMLATATASGLFVHDIATDGALTLRADLPQIGGLGLAEISELALVTTADGTHYVIAAGSGSSSVAVLRLAGATLEVADHILDTRTTRFATTTVLEVIEIDGRVYVVVAGADHGLSMFTMLPNGRLIHLATLEDSLETSLDSGGAIALSGDGGRLMVFVSGGDGEGITRLEFDIGSSGVQRTGGAGTLTGTEGSDVLIAGFGTTELVGGDGHDVLVSDGHAIRMAGGNGTDVFVLSAVAGTIRIADFNPMQDRIDLTMFPMLRSLTQVAIRPTATGAVLTIGSTIIEITTATGASLPVASFRDHLLLPVDRLGDFRTDLPVQGTDNADRLDLGLTETSVSGEGGNDTISGSPGNDTILGGSGADQLFGGEGNDALNGGSESDLLVGGNGNDTLFGEAGNDTLQGGRDHDLLFGGLGHDLLTGENGNDTLHGADDRDTIYGGAANDQLFGGDGADSLFGGSGSDLLNGSAQEDVLHGDEGDDTLLGGLHNDTLYGGVGEDRLFGDEGFDTIYGGAGDDYIDGGQQADMLLGDDGTDTIYGGQGFDVVSGNAGDDLLYGGTEEDWIFGGWNNDTVHGGDGNDWLFGGIGFDTIYGGAGNDQIRGEGGADFLHGDIGNDTILGGQGFDVVSGNAGNDQLFGGEDEDWMFGGWDNDVVDGGAGDDFLFCGLGNDTAYGQNGNDDLSGEWGDDVLFGGAGNDMLRGGAGNDTLFGGGGADRFNLNGGGHDRIMDFDPSQPGEVIIMNGLGLAGGWGALRDTRMTNTPQGVQIDLGAGNSVMLVGVTIDQLAANDFII